MSTASDLGVATPAPAPAGWIKLSKDVFAGTCGGWVVAGWGRARAWLMECVRLLQLSGGIAVTLVGHPFDTLKIRLQSQPIDKPIYCKNATPPLLPLPLLLLCQGLGPPLLSSYCLLGPLNNPHLSCPSSRCDGLCEEDTTMGGCGWAVQGTLTEGPCGDQG